MGDSKNKGKSIVNEYMPNIGPIIGCSNGFDVLGTGDDPSFEENIP